MYFVWKNSFGKGMPQVWASLPQNSAGNIVQMSKLLELGDILFYKEITKEESALSLKELSKKYPCPEKTDD